MKLVIKLIFKSKIFYVYFRLVIIEINRSINSLIQKNTLFFDIFNSVFLCFGNYL